MMEQNFNERVKGIVLPSSSPLPGINRCSSRTSSPPPPPQGFPFGGWVRLHGGCLTSQCLISNGVLHSCTNLFVRFLRKCELRFSSQMCELLAARNNLLKERKILSQEVEFLRKQWMSKTTSSVHATPVDTASHASTEQDEEK